MKKKLKVGIVARNLRDWTGGLYYIKSLIRCVDFLPPDEKPEVLVFVDNDDDFNELRKLIDSKDLVKVIIPGVIRYNFLERVLNKIFRFFFRRNLVEKRFSQHLDILYPYSYDYFFDLVLDKAVYWIPDFQEHFLPEFFSADEIASRKRSQQIISQSGASVVFSSNTAMKHYQMLYPDNNTSNHVLHFASIDQPYNLLDSFQLKKKYQISKPFFYVPNQFWKHKNHKVVIDAVRILLNRDMPCLVMFSGKEYDYRFPEYFGDLKSMVVDAGLEESIKFLGFIDRADVLGLMKEAICVVQPSRFEGWSTVIEDCKSQNAFVALSDIEVHREQIHENCVFFDPNNSVQLANLMEKFMLNKPALKSFDYQENRAKFAKDFMKITIEVSYGRSC